MSRVWKQCESGVDRPVFHKIAEKVILSCAQPENNWKLWNFAMALGKKLTITHTYPQLINILWISLCKSTKKSEPCPIEYVIITLEMHWFDCPMSDNYL